MLLMPMMIVNCGIAVCNGWTALMSPHYAVDPMLNCKYNACTYVAARMAADEIKGHC